MKRIIYILLLCFITNTNIYSQDFFIQEHPIVNTTTIQYCIDSLNFPEININVIEEEAKSKFEMELKNWYSQNPGYENLFKDLDFNQYKAILKTIAINNYPPIPEKVNTGDVKADELTNKENLKKWIEKHPDYPPYIENMEARRKAHLEFYDKYIKNK